MMEIAGAESIGKPEETPVWPQRLLTLMTCEYTRNEGRLFLMAYEKKLYFSDSLWYTPIKGRSHLPDPPPEGGGSSELAILQQ